MTAILRDKTPTFSRTTTNCIVYKQVLCSSATQDSPINHSWYRLRNHDHILTFPRIVFLSATQNVTPLMKQLTVKMCDYKVIQLLKLVGFCSQKPSNSLLTTLNKKKNIKRCSSWTLTCCRQKLSAVFFFLLCDGGVCFFKFL